MSIRLGSQEPTFSVVGEWHHTFGPRAVRMFEKWGVRFYPCQKDEMDVFLARDSHNRFACRTIGITKPRQNGKSFGVRFYAVEAAAVEAKHVLFTAHRGKTVRKMFKFIRAFVLSKKDLSEKLLPGPDGIYKAAGSEGIYFANGGMIEFATRTDGGGRGETYDIIIFDEAQELTDEQYDAIVPTTIASESGDPQKIYLGTPPGPKCQGTVFRGLHDKAHSENPAGIWWLEWSAEELPEMSDPQAVLDIAYATNPAMGYRIREDVMLDVINSATSVDGFAREFLNWWGNSQTALSAIDAKAWQKCKVKNPKREGVCCYAVKFSPDSTSASLAACHKGNDDTLPFVYVVDSRSLNHGLSWFVNTLVKVSSEAAQIVIDGQGSAQTLADRLIDAGVQPSAILRPRPSDVAAACSSLEDAVTETKVTHYGQPALDASATLAQKRPIGKAGGWGFLSTEEVDATLIEAAALAYWAAMTTKRDPTRKAVIWDW